MILGGRPPGKLGRRCFFLLYKYIPEDNGHSLIVFFLISKQSVHVVVFQINTLKVSGKLQVGLT